RRIFQRVLLDGYCDVITLCGDAVTSEIPMFSVTRSGSKMGYSAMYMEEDACGEDFREPDVDKDGVCASEDGLSKDGGVSKVNETELIFGSLGKESTVSGNVNVGDKNLILNPNTNVSQSSIGNRVSMNEVKVPWMFKIISDDNLLNKGVGLVSNFKVGEQNNVTGRGLSDSGGLKQFVSFVTCVAKSFGGFDNNKLKFLSTAMNEEAWNVEGISRIASRIGIPIIMDKITTSICEKPYGKASYAKFLVEVDAVNSLVDTIEICKAQVNVKKKVYGNGNGKSNMTENILNTNLNPNTIPSSKKIFSMNFNGRVTRSGSKMGYSAMYMEEDACGEDFREPDVDKDGVCASEDGLSKDGGVSKVNETELIFGSLGKESTVSGNVNVGDKNLILNPNTNVSQSSIGNRVSMNEVKVPWMFKIISDDNLLNKGVGLVSNFKVGEQNNVTGRGLSDSGGLKQFVSFVTCVAKSFGGFDNNKLKFLSTAMNEEAWNVEGISRIASRIGIPIIMDKITTSICEKPYGKASYAKFLVEVDAVNSLVDTIEICKAQVNVKKKVYGNGNGKSNMTGGNVVTDGYNCRGNMGNSEVSVDECLVADEVRETKTDASVGISSSKGKSKANSGKMGGNESIMIMVMKNLKNGRRKPLTNGFRDIWTNDMMDYFLERCDEIRNDDKIGVLLSMMVSIVWRKLKRILVVLQVLWLKMKSLMVLMIPWVTSMRVMTLLLSSLTILKFLGSKDEVFPLEDLDSLVIKKLDAQCADHKVRLILDEEIKHAMFNIEDDKSAFISERPMSDNIHLAQEFMNSCSCKGGARRCAF
nr:zinc knuckle CX2CX4HX4C [Tanacetum cinerariifolium]